MTYTIHTPTPATLVAKERKPLTKKAAKAWTRKMFGAGWQHWFVTDAQTVRIKT